MMKSLMRKASFENLEKIINDSQAIFLAGKHGLPITIYNLYNELGPES